LTPGLFSGIMYIVPKTQGREQLPERGYKHKGQ
jgi:hypothetical protein